MDIRNEAGDRIIAGRRLRARQVDHRSGTAREVSRDLEALLNTVALESTIDMTETPYARKSILNFGIPDMTNRTIDEDGVNAIPEEIRTAIINFEPRLAAASLADRARQERRYRRTQGALHRPRRFDLRSRACSGGIHRGYHRDRQNHGQSLVKARMNREFLDLYNRELQLLNEQAREFAEEYPGIAERLGGILEDRIDPLIGGLLEGAAFLAARVQLKLKHEFPEFTNNLLEQLVPHYLAPTPSMMLVKVNPDIRRQGAARRASRSPAVLISTPPFVSSIARSPAAIGYAATSPFGRSNSSARSISLSPAPLQALGVSVGGDVLAGMRLTLTHRTAARLEDELPDSEALKKPEMLFAGCRTTNLPLYFAGSEADAVALYEQLFAHCRGIYFRCLDEFGDPVVHPAPAQCLHQVGFQREDALFPNDHRVFEGFDLLREFFMFPRKFLGCNLTRLDEVLPKLKAKTVDILFAFDEVNARLAAAVQPSMFALYAAPAINLFEKTTDRIPLKSSQHEYHVVPDRSHYLDYEPHRLLEVYAHYSGGSEKVPVQPLYSASLDEAAAAVGAVLHRAPAAPAAHGRGKAPGRVVRLYRNRHVHLLERARRRR